MPSTEFTNQLKEYIIESIRSPASAAHKIAFRADFAFGLKVFVLMTVLVFVVNFVLNMAYNILDVIASLGFGLKESLGSVFNAIVQPILSLIVFPFALVCGLILSVIEVGIIWFVGRMLGGKAEFGKLYGSLVVVQSGLLLLQTLFNQLVSLALGVIMAAVGITTALGVISKIKFLGVIASITALLTGTSALGMFSVISLAFFIAGIYYSTIFVREIHEISTGKALIAVIVPIAITVAIVLVFLASILAILGISLAAVT